MSARFAVIFDMDGVILDTEPLAMRAWMAAAAEARYPLTEEHCYDMIGLGVCEARAYVRSHISESIDLRKLELKAAVYYRAFIAEGIACKAGLSELLAFLERQGIPKAIATSTRTDLARDNLKRAGVLDHFATIVGGEQVKRGKPAPDIYELAAQRLAFPPEHCIVLEDSAAGIRAAAGAGMTPILIPDLCRIPVDVEQLAFALAASLHDVIPILQRLELG